MTTKSVVRRLVFDQNMANQTFDAISGHSISQFLTNRQADSKMRLVLVQTVNNGISDWQHFDTTFKEIALKVFVTFDAVAFQTSTPSFKFIPIIPYFQKNQSHSESVTT